MTTFNELNESNSTIIVFEGKELRTTQNPYVGDNGDTYKAHAVDQNDAEYEIIWDVSDPFTEDESDACDWDSPASVKAL